MIVIVIGAEPLNQAIIEAYEYVVTHKQSVVIVGAGDAEDINLNPKFEFKIPTLVIEDFASMIVNEIEVVKNILPIKIWRTLSNINFKSRLIETYVESNRCRGTPYLNR
jgi:hypothetical protein